MIMVEVTKIWWDGERLMAEPVDSAIMYKDNEVAQPDSTCNNTLRAEGKGYPRTCRKCGKGPCIADRVQPKQEPMAHTTGHCENHKQKGGCQLHNLQCGWPDCDRKPITTPPQRKPLTDKMVLIAARVMSDRQADACNVDKEDQWKVYGQDFIDDARAMLEAAHNIKENT